MRPSRHSRFPRHPHRTSRTPRTRLEALEARTLLAATIDSALTFGSTSATEDRITGMAVDVGGTIYVTGHFHNTMDIDPGAPSVTLTSNGGSDIFVAAYKSDNSLLWAKSFGGAQDEVGGDLVLSNGGVVITAMYRSSIDANPEAAVTTLASAGSSDVMISRFTTSGVFQWAHSYGGAGTDTGYRMKADKDNNLFIVGKFDQVIDFAPGVAQVTQAPQNAAGDLYLLKLNSGGGYTWHNTYIYDDVMTITGLGVDSNGNAHIAGTLRGQADLDGSSGGAFTVNSTNYVGYVVKMATNGARLTSQTFGQVQGGPNDTIRVNDLAVDVAGNMIIVGNFGGTVDMNPGTGSHLLTEAQSPGALSGFVLKLDSSANFSWAGALTGDSWSEVLTVTNDTSNNIYIGGEFNKTIDFNIKAGTTNRTAPNTLNTQFVAKYDSRGNFLYELHASAGTGASYTTRVVPAPGGGAVAAGYFLNSITFPSGAFTPNTQDNFIIRINSGFPPQPTAQFEVTPLTSLEGQPVTIKVTLTAEFGVPTGNVIFKDFAHTLGTVALDDNGTATVTVSNFVPGQHSLTFLYSGDSNFLFTGNNPTIQTTSVNHAPIGNLDSTANGALSGWTADLNEKDTPLLVQLEIDGVVRATMMATNQRGDLQASIGATNHGFMFQLPPLEGGVHPVRLITYDPLTGAGKVLATTSITSFSLYFDEAWYLRTYGDIAAAVSAGTIGSGWLHYQGGGAKEGRSPSAYFDEQWYRAKYADVGAAIAAGGLSSAFQHFVSAGSKEGRDPSPFFNELFYRRAYTDVGTAVSQGALNSGFQHFMLAGLVEGRSGTPWFNAANYRTANTDIHNAINTGQVRSAFDHFISRGIIEKRSPGKYYIEADYLVKNPDIAAAVTNGAIASGLAHFVRFGFYEGRTSYSAFDATWYRAQYSDVNPLIADGTVKSAFHHFLLFGQLQGKKPQA